MDKGYIEREEALLEKQSWWVYFIVGVVVFLTLGFSLLAVFSAIGLI